MLERTWKILDSSECLNTRVFILKSMAKILKRVYKGEAANKYGTCVFLDFRQAFDIVDTQILFNKLLVYGI